ncbi:MAG: sugar MFS transporter [Hormoscilla sp.]
MNPVSIVALLALFTFGIISAFMGTFKLRLAQKMMLDDARIGQLIALLQASRILGTILVGYYLQDRFGYQLVLTAGFLILLAAIWLFARAHNFFTAKIASCGLGLSGCCLNIGGYTLLAAVNPDNLASAGNLGGAFFGIGAFLLPFGLAYLFELLSFRGALKLLAMAMAVFLVPVLLSSYPQIQSDVDPSTVWELKKNGVIWIAAFVLFCALGLEHSLANWTTTYLQDVGWNEKLAEILLSLFWLALMVGRFVAARFITPDNTRLAIQVMALLATVIVGLMILKSKRYVSAIAVVGMGLSLGPILPTTVALTFAKFPPSDYSRVYGFLSLFGTGGALVVPSAIGFLSKQKSIRPAMRLLFALAGVLFLLTFLL